MPQRLQKTRSRLGDVLLYADTDRPVRLHFDQHRTGAHIRQAWMPTAPGAAGGVALDEWTWQNGPGGAGTTIETATSYAAGASDYGEFVWLRRLGVAAPAGRLTEIPLPAGAGAQIGGRLWGGQLFDGDLWITTNTRYILKITDATGADGISETDFGSGANTSGLAVFNGAGAGRLYVGDPHNGIWEYNGTSWTEGEAGTERTLLATPTWRIGDALATGGAAGGAGTSAPRLVGTNPTGTGFYHVAGDPKVAANWSALTTVGTGGTAFPIRSLISSNRTVFFGTGLGVFGVNELGESPNFTKWVEYVADDNFTGVWATYWAGLIWFTTAQGLAAFDPNGQRVDLARTFRFGADSGISEIFGAMQVMAPSEDGLYAGVFNPLTLDSYVGCLLFDESGGFRWSMAEAVLPGIAIQYVQQVTDANGNPHLFMGGIDSSSRMHLYVQDLPRSGDPEADYRAGGTFRAAASWNLTLSRFNGGRAVSKTARRFMLEADQLGDDFPSNSVDFLVANDGGAFVTQGTSTRTRWNAQPKANTAQATSMQVRLEVENDEDAPVVIRAASVLYSSHPELSRVIAFPAIIGEGRPGEDPRVHLQRLERAQRGGPIVIDDFFGRRIEGTVSLENERIVPEAAGKGYTVHADVTILVTRQVSRVDAGDTTDGGYVAS